jgi:6-phosphofructokinase 1
VLLPERPRSREEIVQSIFDCIRTSFDVSRDKTRVLIIKAEGVEVPTHDLVAEVGKMLGENGDFEIRGTVLGHLVRGGSASFRDRLLAGRFGLVAVDAVLAGTTDVMAGWNITDRGEPTSDVLTETEALLQGTSEVVRERVRRMEEIQGVLSL